MSDKTEYSASDIVGANITTALPTNIYKYVDNNGVGGGLISTLPPNSIVGVVDSYIVKNGQLYWQIKSPTLNYGVDVFYVKHSKDGLNVDENTIYVSPQDLIDAQPTLTETIVATILKIATIGAVAYGLTKILNNTITTKINQKKLNNETIT